MGFRTSPRAEQDLDEIWDYVYASSKSAVIARNVVQSIGRFPMLALHPHLGRARSDLRPGLRSFPVGAYIILYRVEGDGVAILLAVRGDRDIEALLAEEN